MMSSLADKAPTTAGPAPLPPVKTPPAVLATSSSSSDDKDAPPVAPDTPAASSPARAPLSPHAAPFTPHAPPPPAPLTPHAAPFTPPYAFTFQNGPASAEAEAAAAAAAVAGGTGGWPLYFQPAPLPVAAPAPYGFVPCPPLPKDGLGVPCRTLFVGNLDGGVAPAEVRAAFALCPGFRGVKCEGARTTGAIAFADFDSTADAAAALAARQGALLATNPRGGLRLSFARAPLRVRPLWG